MSDWRTLRRLSGRLTTSSVGALMEVSRLQRESIGLSLEHFEVHVTWAEIEVDGDAPVFQAAWARNSNVILGAGAVF